MSILSVHNCEPFLTFHLQWNGVPPLIINGMTTTIRFRLSSSNDLVFQSVSREKPSQVPTCAEEGMRKITLTSCSAFFGIFTNGL